MDVPLRETFANVAASAVQAFLKAVGSQTEGRGRSYFESGRVKALEEIEPGFRYVASVRGSDLYSVELTYDDDSWFTDCTCPVSVDCKHGVAALLALMSKGPSAAGAQAAQPAKVASAGLLEQAAVEALKRPLTQTERQFVKKVEQLHRRNPHARTLAEWDLREFAPNFISKDRMPLQLWDRYPGKVLEFWNYVAFALRHHGVTFPKFLAPITDLEWAGKQIARARREREVEHWRYRIEHWANHEPSLATTSGGPSSSSSQVAELRLMFVGRSVVIQSKNEGDKEFRILKVSRIKALFEQYRAGQLQVSPEMFPLWHALAVRWEFQRHTEFRLEYEETQRVLNPLLRQPALNSCFVSRDGKPLARVTEPLQWLLDPAATQDDDYRLRLVTADGKPVPPVLATLTGSPALYITDTAIYSGPPPFLDKSPYEGSFSPSAQMREQSKSFQLSIPAAALESRSGVNFLGRLGVELPQRIKERVSVATMKVTLCCDLRPSYPQSKVEYIFLRITAQASIGTHSEQYTVGGWAKPYGPIQPTAEPANDRLLQYDRRAMAEVPQLLLALAPQWSHQDDSWRFRASKHFPDTFVPWLRSLPKHIEVLLDRNLATLMKEPVYASVRLEVTPAGVDWFDLEVVVDVGATELTPEELKMLLAARGGYVRLGKKGWRRLAFNFSAEDDERLARLGLNAREFTNEPQRLHVLQLADEAAARFLSAEQVAEVRRRAEELQTRVTPPVPADITGQLRPYQIEGFHFLCYLSTNRFGGILADDMGLGKTLQTLAWLAWLRAPLNGSHRPSLVVCPKSVTDNWRAEAERFLPGLRVRVWRGTDLTQLEAAIAGADLFVVNYTQLRLLGDALVKQNWLAAILDEGQYIKNPTSQTARMACAVQAEHRLALTGTPIENRLLDLWSLMSFAMPGVLGNRAQFTRQYDQTDDPLARRRLSGRVRPFLLRRAKAQVATDLPDRVEEDLLCEMEGAQETLYRAEFKSAQQMLLRIKTASEFDRQRFNFLHSLLRLRQLCCHPALVDPKQSNAPSAKIEALVELLEPLIEEGHKVLVFSQFVSLLDLLKPIVRERNWPHFVLTGDTEDRGALVTEFQKTEGAAVFLISLKAGGFGLNLTAASYVVLFDPWWNPAVENQAIDRTHRIGQTSKVIAYRLLIKNSIEEKIRALQRTKRALAEDILGEEKLGQSLTLDDLRFLFADGP